MKSDVQGFLGDPKVCPNSIWRLRKVTSSEIFPHKCIQKTKILKVDGEIPSHFSQLILLYQENISFNFTFLSRQTEFGHNFGSWRKP